MNPNNLILSPPGAMLDVLACLFFPPGAAAAGRCAAGLAKLKVLYQLSEGATLGRWSAPSEAGR